MHTRLFALSLIAIAACHDGSGTQSEPKQVEPTGSAPAVAQGSSSGSDEGSAQAINANDYVPAEFKSGMARWKDTVVYLDGQPIAYLQWGELPIALKPTWVKDKVSTNKPAGCPECPSWKWSKQRFYKFTDYFRAIGVDPKTINEVHVYGPKLTSIIVVGNKDLNSKAADEFMFRFGAEVSGKAIPHVPPNFGNRKAPDKLAAVMIYVKKKPPKMTEDGPAFDDGQVITGVPYYGEPVRGGVRIYLDDKMVAIIKRQELDGKKATPDASGELHWSFAQFLKDKGIDTSKLVEGWVIRDDKREEKIPWSELQNDTFEASAQAKGGILLGDKKVLANAIALHTREIKPDEIPQPDPDEEM